MIAQVGPEIDQNEQGVEDEIDGAEREEGESAREVAQQRRALGVDGRGGHVDMEPRERPLRERRELRRWLVHAHVGRGEGEDEEDL